MIIDPLESLAPGKYLSLARNLREDQGDRHKVKLALLSSNSFSFLEPYIVVECARRNMAVTPWVAPFGQIEQAVLECSDSLSIVNADIIVIALRIEDVFADAFLRTGGDKLRDRSYECVERLVQCVAKIRTTSDTTVLVANFVAPQVANIAGVFDAGHGNGPANIVGAVNAELAVRLSEYHDVLIWDYSGLVHSRGTSGWTDERLWHLARQPIAAANLPYAASHLARTIAGTVFKPMKCLVLDLDNTLWGGAAGDDGIGGIQIGDDYPGNQYKAFQSAVLGLKDRGVLLAIVSKNDEQLVRQIFNEHPDLVISWDDFSIAKVNWNAKSENLKAIATELNIGIDSLVFFDDSPVEREEVRQHAPEVSVMDVPESPLAYVTTLLGSGLFDVPALSDEDGARAGYYKSEKRRQEFRERAASMESFLIGLEMSITIDSVGPETINRAAQLIGKTNQFNLTTRRHSKNALIRMVDDGTYDVRWTRLADRYGDSGIIGVTVLHFQDMVATIDSFVMSCRVMNRSIEQGMLLDAIEQAQARGCTSVRGQYIVTERNAIVSNFYEDSGFAEVVGKEGEGFFVLDLSGTEVWSEWPKVLRRSRS